MGPDIFVLDEPSSNLDIKSIRELKNVLQEWKSQGQTIVIAEHRLYYLMDIADRVLYMQDVNHQLFTESVLDEILLGLDNPDKEQDACRIEYATGDESFRRLQEIFGKMK